VDAKFVTDVIGSAAAILSVASFVPQIVKMIQTKDVSGVSLRTYALTVTCFALWIAYGARLGAWPIIVSNAFALTMSAVVLFLKWRFSQRDVSGAESVRTRSP